MVATAWLVAAAAAGAQPLPESVPLDTWGPAGTVHAVARHGDTLYVGGLFDYVGPGTGPFAVFDIDSPEPGLTAGGFGGSLDRILAMPDGGWIVAGSIRDPSGAYRNIARLDDQGRFDPAWFVDVGGPVDALATDGTRVFIGGYFSTVNGTARTGLAAVDAMTGALLPWNPVLEISPYGIPTVTGMLAHQGALYVAGTFTEVNDAARTGFAALDAATAATLPTTLLGLADVSAMAASGDTLYLAGRLPSLQEGGVALSIATGQLLPWAMPPGYSRAVSLVVAPARVFVATDDAVRALDPITGAAIGPPLVSGAFVRTMAAGGSVLAVALTEHTPFTRHRVVTFDATTGHSRPWSFAADRIVDSIQVRDGRLAIGGEFTSAGGVPRRNLFALDVPSGRPTPFAPSIDGDVYAVATVGRIVVAGGSFYRVNGVDQRGLAAMAGDTGALLPWAPLQDGSVYSLAVGSDTLFVGGRFLAVNGFSRPNLAGIPLSTGAVSTWLPVPDAAVWALTASGDRLIAGGEFTAMAGGPRGAGAAFALGTGTLTAWDPQANGRIQDLAMAGDITALVGDFTTLGGQPRSDFGVVDGNGAPLALRLPFSTIGARAVASIGHQVIVGGRFFTGGTEFRSLFAVSTQSGLLAWNPVVEDNNHYAGQVTVLARYPDILVAGGEFSLVEGRRVLNLAIFPAPGAGPPTAMRARVTGNLATLGWTAPAGTVPSAYVVEAGTAQGATNVGRFPVPSNGISGALPPGTFYVRVRAVVNGVEGQASSEVVLTIPAAPVPPSAPAGLAASVGGGTVSLSWTAAAGNAESYVIEAGTLPGQANLASFDTGVLDTGFSARVAPGTYYVRIRARNAFGLSAPSGEATFVVP